MSGIGTKTGTDANVAGLYTSECCDHEVWFVEGQTFTRCVKCSRLTSLHGECLNPTCP
jgi:hypothetical protein